MSSIQALVETAEPGSSAVAGARFWTPFPGLRPFQPDEAEYFFGRKDEVREVLERLRNRRFVTVIGGSGSGKSSLVLAGAISRLRSFGIKDAGDFWTPVVATPGTNHVEGDSPIKRLARKFCAELVDSDDVGQLEACVTLLRRRNGLGELVERYGRKLKDSDGVSLDILPVNFLFLLDQFEELFHPSNARAPIADDCQQLVDRLVEQFETPHPQVCVALTMRSEHLNDCPRYEKLPDALNASFYLVKRLGNAQLRDAIEQPVLRYLRKHVAAQYGAEIDSAKDPGLLPDSIPIQAELIDRLLDDCHKVLAQQDHADQLPLLQHVLFWIWHEATARCEGKPLVDCLVLDDLWSAVYPRQVNDEPPDTSRNTLESCLENRCEEIFSRQIARQAGWEEAFRSLAFKEPNSGTYTQQRASMAELRDRLKITASSGDSLAQCLEPWRRPHAYLHWDYDSQTVKVAHETLIRRWQRFRRWIDDEDRQFHVYLRLVEDCERWKANRALWIEGNSLLGYENEQLPVILRDPVRVARLNRLLALCNTGQRPMKVTTSEAASFLEQSITRRSELARKRKEDEDRAAADRERAQRNARRTKLATRTVAVLFALATLAMLVVWGATNLGDTERTLDASNSLALESQAVFSASQTDLIVAAGPQDLLNYGLLGAYFLDIARHHALHPADWLLIYARRLKAVHRWEQAIDVTAAVTLRTILAGGAWGVGNHAQRTPQPAAEICRKEQSEESTNYLVQRPNDAKGRALILTIGANDRRTVSVGHKEADGTGTGTNCVIDQQLLSPPPESGSRIGITSDASNIVIAYPAYTQFYAVRWDGGTPSAPVRANVATQLQDQFKEGLLLSRRGRFWTDVMFRHSTVRLFDVEPSVVSETEAEGGRKLKIVNRADTRSVCTRFATIPNLNLPDPTWWELPAPPNGTGDDLTYCLRVTRQRGGIKPAYTASLYAAAATSVSDNEEKPQLLIDEVPLPTKPVDVSLDRPAGQIAFHGDDGSWRAVPWGLGLLRRMANKVYDAPLSVNARAGKNSCDRSVDRGQFSLPLDMIYEIYGTCPSDRDLIEGVQGGSQPEVASFLRQHNP